MSEQILRLPVVMAMTGKPRSSIYAEIKEGRFPAQVHIGKRAVGWTRSSIEAWMQSKIAGTDEGTHKRLQGVKK